MKASMDSVELLRRDMTLSYFDIRSRRPLSQGGGECVQDRAVVRVKSPKIYLFPWLDKRGPLVIWGGRLVDYGGGPHSAMYYH